MVGLIWWIVSSNPAAGAWVAASLLPNPRCRLKLFVPIVRAARDAPIVRVAHGWGVGVEALKKITLFFWLTGDSQKSLGK